MLGVRTGRLSGVGGRMPVGWGLKPLGGGLAAARCWAQPFTSGREPAKPMEGGVGGLATIRGLCRSLLGAALHERLRWLGGQFERRPEPFTLAFFAAQRLPLRALGYASEHAVSGGSEAWSSKSGDGVCVLLAC